DRRTPPLPTPASEADAAPRTASDGAVQASAPYLRSYHGRDYAAAADLAADAVGRDPRDADAWATLIRALANAGRMDEAERACSTALERRPDAAPLTYLHAVLLSRRGQFAAAAAAARRAVYLDRSLAVAQITLGTALARLGERDQARRAFRAAERILERLPDDAPVPLADGENARRLAEAARAHRRRIEASSA
ncbi:MAG TPA: tetratricopeptide repeat protein, partial [Gemmatimonadaceae bacterium]|nr:tetratricopeptide repeat protein [Gemmatimonadaceae bacterium]